MQTVWRITTARFAATAFSGEGARLYGGRWNPKGREVVYTAQSQSLDPFASLGSWRVAERAHTYGFVVRWSEAQPIGG